MNLPRTGRIGTPQNADGYAVLRKFYTQHGRFPRGLFELPGATRPAHSESMVGLAQDILQSQQTGVLCRTATVLPVALRLALLVIARRQSVEAGEGGAERG